MKQAELKGISDQYAAFAADEARGSSEAYEKLALAASQSDDLLEFIATLPVERRQPNLFLAAVRHVCGIARNVDDLRQFVHTSQGQIREVMLSRTTQTNEPARCAVLLPLLAQLAQPLALIEVGASAGLCLLMDHYGYDYGKARIEPAVSDDGHALVCESARGPDADRHVKPLIQFAVDGSLSGAYSQSRSLSEPPRMPFTRNTEFTITIAPAAATARFSEDRAAVACRDRCGCPASYCRRCRLHFRPSFNNGSIADVAALRIGAINRHGSGAAER